MKRNKKRITTAGVALGLVLALLLAAPLGCKKPDLGCQRYVGCCKHLMASGKTKSLFGDACANAERNPETYCGDDLRAVNEVFIKTRMMSPPACSPAAYE